MNLTIGLRPWLVCSSLAVFLLVVFLLLLAAGVLLFPAARGAAVLVRLVDCFRIGVPLGRVVGLGLVKLAQNLNLEVLICKMTSLTNTHLAEFEFPAKYDLATSHVRGLPMAQGWVSR